MQTKVRRDSHTAHKRGHHVCAEDRGKHGNVSCCELMQYGWGQVVGCTPASFSGTGLDQGLQIVVSSPLEGCPMPQDAANAEIDAKKANGPRAPPLPRPANSLAGRCLVVFRGGCTFEEKSELAKDAGASALLVINTEPGMPVRMAMPNSKDVQSSNDFDFPICMVCTLCARGSSFLGACGRN